MESQCGGVSSGIGLYPVETIQGRVFGAMSQTPAETPRQTQVRFRPVADTLILEFTGPWRLRDARPSPDDLTSTLDDAPAFRGLQFNTNQLREWDSGLLTYLLSVEKVARERGLLVDRAGLPDGVRRLLELACAVPASDSALYHREPPDLLARVGEFAISTVCGLPQLLRFVGELIVAQGRLLTGRARFRSADLALVLQEVGPQALPIVSLISFLVGLILAYMGAVQLAQFGAEVFIADLVAIGMVREIGALMTGVIMAGRTGAAFAAQLGTMQVNEEIDALRTLGISPMEFLVLPRVLALCLMMPLLTVYADLVGMLAGLVVAVGVFDIGVFEYYNQTLRALTLDYILVGLVKGTVYGMLVAIAGCLRGMQCGRSAQAVGEATTSAVVTGILFIVVSGSLLTILFQEMGI